MWKIGREGGSERERRKGKRKKKGKRKEKEKEQRGATKFCSFASLLMTHALAPSRPKSHTPPKKIGPAGPAGWKPVFVGVVKLGKSSAGTPDFWF